MSNDTYYHLVVTSENMVRHKNFHEIRMQIVSFKGKAKKVTINPAPVAVQTQIPKAEKPKPYADPYLNADMIWKFPSMRFSEGEAIDKVFKKYGNIYKRLTKAIIYGGTAGGLFIYAPMFAPLAAIFAVFCAYNYNWYKNESKTLVIDRNFIGIESMSAEKDYRKC